MPPYFFTEADESTVSSAVLERAESDGASAVAAAVPAQAITEEGAMLARYADGDEHAMDALIERYQEDGFWTARQFLKDDSSALDVVQEAFLRVIKNRDRYDPTRPFRAWFLQIVRNLAIDQIRRVRREVACCDVIKPVDYNHGADMERAEVDTRVQEVLGAVPEKYRRLLVMRELEGVRADAIAARIGVDYTTTRWRIHHARKLFKREWESRFGRYEN